MSEPNGKDYRATARISNRDDVTVADVDETCERVDPKSLGWLLAQGYIVPVAPSFVIPVETGEDA